PEFTLLEAYACVEDHWSLEPLLRDLIADGIDRLEAEGLADTPEARSVWTRFRAAAGGWKRQTYGELLRQLDSGFDLEALLRSASDAGGQDASPGEPMYRDAQLHAEAIEARAGDARLRDAAAQLAYQAGGLAPYLRAGPQGYWYDFLEHAFRTKIAPSLQGPVIVHDLPVESSPLAESHDGIHSLKWELYLDGVRVALGQRELMDAQAQTVRFQHLDRLRRQGYDLLPEPDETFLEDLARWPGDRPVIGMGLYVDRLAGSLLGLVRGDGQGQERMLPNLYKGYTR
ncbi:MAG: amino acid--tRNA ligase-related protein, partial [Dehalococcoidia bacterium]